MLHIKSTLTALVLIFTAQLAQAGMPAAGFRNIDPQMEMEAGCFDCLAAEPMDGHSRVRPILIGNEVASTALVAEDHGAGSQLEPIGSVYNEDFGFNGSGWQIDSCHILTTAHNVVGAKNGKTKRLSGWPENRDALNTVTLTFRKGQGNDVGGFDKTMTKRNLKVVEIGDYDPYSDAPQSLEDFALLRLQDEDCGGPFISVVPTPFHLAQSKNGMIIKAGYDSYIIKPGKLPGEFTKIPRPKGKILVHRQAGVGLPILDEDVGLWRGITNTAPGGSGSPYMIEGNKVGPDGKRKLYAIAMHVAGPNGINSDFGAQGFNAALPMEHIYPRIAKHLNSLKTAAPSK